MNNHSPCHLDCIPEGQRGQRKSLLLAVKLPIIKAIKQEGFPKTIPSWENRSSYS